MTSLPPTAGHGATARKLTFVLFSAQALASAGFIAAATVASIVGADLSGREAWAGVPSATYLVGSALAAYLWGLVMDRLGRRAGLALGLASGVAGAFIAALAVVAGSFVVLLAGLSLMGAAHAAVQLGRFAAAEVNPPERKGRAVANVVIGGTAGAVLGPLMVGPVGRWAQEAGLGELAGPYLASLMMFALAGLVIFTFLRPDPRDLGREMARLQNTTQAPDEPARPLAVVLRQPAVFTAVAAMVAGQAVMVMLMVITALHMTHHQHSLAGVSVVISSHTLGMYAFSIISGQLSDRWGRAPVILAGASALLLASALAALSPALLPLAIALFLLGLGWNLCFVGGSSLLADQLRPAERARTQGAGDLFIGLASAASSLGSGLIFAALGYGVMCLVGGVVAFGLLCLTLWWQQRRTRQVEPALG